MSALADLPHDFELDHLALALEYVSQFRCAVDGGACTGIWTRAMAQRFERVFAFEPVEENRKRIPEMDNVDVEPYALGPYRAHATFAPGESNIGEWHVEECLNVPADAEANMFALDDFDLHEIDFAKFDLEGFELMALKGARGTIERCRPVILIEEKWHGQQYYGLEQNAATHWLEALGYHVVARIGRDVILTC